LGTITSNQYWRWAAFGKHPVASDFFGLGEDIPLTKGFSNWVQKGYETLISKKSASTGLYAWRFWARGSQKENIACGVIRDSSDSVGRPYPLLIMGTGPLPGWEKNWDLLPFACERTWDQIEYLSALVANDFKKLEVEVRHIRPPHHEWPELTTKRKGLEDLWSNSNTNNSSSNLKDMERQASSVLDKVEFIVYLDQTPFQDQFSQVSLWHYFLKKHVKVAPNAIFMGGTLDKAYLAIFRKPLIATDFVQLWSIASVVPSPLPSPPEGEGGGEG
jgi:type VI secretion system protein VasJ